MFTTGVLCTICGAPVYLFLGPGNFPVRYTNRDNNLMERLKSPFRKSYGQYIV